jgi:hypothetical protein
MTHGDEPLYNIDNDDEPELIRCDHFDVCEAWIPDGHGYRIGPVYLCAACYYAQPAVIEGLTQDARADERRDDR